MMSVRHVAAVLLLLLTGACGRRAAETTAPSPPKNALKAAEDDTTERHNLLNYARGAVVVSRTGEFALWASALLAIDGDPDSCWFVPPHEPGQQLVAALPVESRIDQIGISNAAAAVAISSVTFESSMDGINFSPLGTVERAAKKNAVLVPVRPVTARYVRATIKDDSKRDGLALCSLQVRGVETGTRSVQDLTGCWIVNGSKLTLAQDGDHVFGQLEGSKPTLIDGGSDGRFVRFVWVRDREFGYGAFSVEESGHHLSGRLWHEEPIPIFSGEAWFGERSSCTGRTMVGGGTVAATFFQRAGRFPLYGLRAASDGTIEVRRSAATLRALAGLIQAAGPHHIRLEAHEFRRKDAAANRAWAGRELSSLHDLLGGGGVRLGDTELAVLGSEKPRQNARTEDQRALYSVIEIVVPATKTLAH